MSLFQVYSSSTPLRVGYYDTDGYVLLPPCMRRAVKETRHALQAAGHQVSTTTPASLLTEEITLQKPDTAPKHICGIILPQPHNTRQGLLCLREQCISGQTAGIISWGGAWMENS